MSVAVSVESKRFECHFVLEHKLSVIVGDSGRGKSQLVDRVSSSSSAVKVEVTKGYEPFVLTESVFRQFINKAKRAVKLGRYKNLKGYWTDGNFPLESCIIFIDDEDFIVTRDFDLFFNADTSNYYVVINRTKLSGVTYSVSDVFEFCTEGRSHWLKRKYDLSIANDTKPSIVITEYVNKE